MGHRARAAGKGIIPAFAGSTFLDAMWSPPKEDHPRIRGEHSPCAVQGVGDEGSSPHSRGAPWCVLYTFEDLRIIPAFAGSTREPRLRLVRLEDHPRIRGEHMPERPPLFFTTGSSPHSRGAPERLALQHEVVGIIPAFAGSTSAARPLSGHKRDHPRIRGEHSLRLPRSFVL